MVATDDREVVRPLRVIEAELQQLFREADEAAEEARQPFYDKASPLLLEALTGHFKGNRSQFYNWATTKFGKSQLTIRTCVARAGAPPNKPLKSLHETKYAEPKQGGLGWTRPISREWAAPVDEVAQRARKEALRIAQEDVLTRAQERDAEKKLSNRLIDIGYKVLAKELHPDKMGGDKTAFQRLGRVRDKLKHSLGV
jgi:hypothetical protein